MSDYKRIKPSMEGLEENYVLRTADMAYIPFDPANSDYQGYLEWLKDGNIPDPPDL